MADALPGIIESDSEYERIERIFDDLISRKSLSPEEDRLFGLLAKLLEEYGARTLEPIPELSPRQLLANLIMTNNLRQSDLTDVFGTQSIVSEVVNGKREITKSQAKALAESFALKVEAFV